MFFQHLPNAESAIWLLMVKCDLSLCRTCFHPSTVQCWCALYNFNSCSAMETHFMKLPLSVFMLTLMPVEVQNSSAMESPECCSLLQTTLSVMVSVGLCSFPLCGRVTVVPKYFNFLISFKVDGGISSRDDISWNDPFQRCHPVTAPPLTSLRMTVTHICKQRLRG